MYKNKHTNKQKGNYEDQGKQKCIFVQYFYYVLNLILKNHKKTKKKKTTLKLA